MARGKFFVFFGGGGFRKIVDLLFLVSQIDLIQRSLKHIKQYLLEFLLKRLKNVYHTVSIYEKCLS